MILPHKNMFCPKCKSIMKPTHKDGKIILTCANCDLEINPTKMPILKDKAKVTSEKYRRSMEAADESHNILAVHSHVCSKCGHDKAEIIEKGIWYSDEDHVVIYKCGKCGHSEMEADKVK